jgi:hypothetical protein
MKDRLYAKKPGSLMELNIIAMIIQLSCTITQNVVSKTITSVHIRLEEGVKQIGILTVVNIMGSENNYPHSSFRVFLVRNLLLRNINFKGG